MLTSLRRGYWQPLSRRSREYILKFDIEEDARLLKETLNIQGAAVDCFRASSKLLQEGVKAGLSLYDIAILCCRNDNLGEIPSNLEILMKMATELATSAVENGRWHHTTASRAIAEQLAPPAAGGTKGACVIKSASSADFSSFASNESSDVPGMVQSSASDASSDVGDAVIDGEECEEWAAAVVADVSKEKNFLSPTKSSEDSESSSDDTILSSSSRGFWQTRPGEHESDDDSVSWSPYSSPRASVDLSKTTALNPPYERSTPFKSSVSFADSMRETFLLPPPATIDVSDVAKSTEVLSRPCLIRRTSSGMSRSQSYSSFRSPNSKGTNKSVSDGHWRSYFSKFVDLAIKREVSAAAQVLIA
mmetsp:Transcript_22723/g.52564  ORF Transcript_22723/g.52564 Transcript_22723/m.52564 type:complete len:362 (-) Transcript_22723:2520-3605(-)